MGHSEQKQRIFISCFYEEFRHEERLLEQALKEQGYEIPHLGSIGGTADELVKAHLKLIENCDVFIGIYGAFHGGFVPTTQAPFHKDYSYLELDYRTADELGKPILAFVQRVRGRDEELSRLVPLIVKRRESYWFDTVKDLVPSVLDHLRNLWEKDQNPNVQEAELGEEEVIRPKVFLSYAREDIELAQRLFNNLRDAGIDVWFDKESLLPGQKWKAAIKGAISESRFFLALLSSNSISKVGYVQKELKVALDKLDEFPESEIFLIPIRLDDCKPSDDRLGELHWVDMFPDWDSGLVQIIRTIKSEVA